MSLTEASKIAELKPAFFLHLEVEEPRAVIANTSVSEVVVIIKNGYTKTLDPEYPFDTTVYLGWDTLRTNTATPQTTSLDCHLFSKTAADKGIHIIYSGLMVGTQKQNDVVVTKKSKAHDYTESYLTMHPTIITDDGVDAESWATKKNFLGKGRFTRDAEGNLAVEYYVYVLE